MVEILEVLLTGLGFFGVELINTAWVLVAKLDIDGVATDGRRGADGDGDSGW